MTMPYTILFTVLFVSPSGFTQEPTGCETQIQCEVQKVQDEKNGSEICRDRTGNIAKEAHWSKGQLEGRFRCQKANNRGSLEAFFKSDSLHGEYREYDVHLKRWTIQNYNMGQREGLKIEPISEGRTRLSFYKNNAKYGFTYIVGPNDNLISAYECENNHQILPQDKCLLFIVPELDRYLLLFRDQLAAQNKSKKASFGNRIEYYPSGRVFSKYFLSESGVLEGPYTSFYENGKKEREVQYKSGKKQGTEKLYFSTGTLKEENRYSESGNLLQRISFYMNELKKDSYKVIKSDVESKWMQLIEKEDYYPNGALYFKGSYFENQVRWIEAFEGMQTYYNETGDLLLKTFWTAGKRTGIWYQRKEKIYTEQIYDNDTLIKEIDYDLNSKVKLKETLFNPDGSLKSTRPLSK